MSLTNSRNAWVNRSNTTIPVWGSLVPSPNGIHPGGLTAGGVQLGAINPNDFYTTVPHGTQATYREVRFRSNLGHNQPAYIETHPGTGMGNTFAWVASQEPYHRWNSNGSTLVTAPVLAISGGNFYQFIVTGGESYIVNSAAVNQGTLPIGTQIATDRATVGQTLPNFMYFRYIRRNGVWEDFFNSGDRHAFVDLGIANGVSPSTRRLR
jgi:hypothetical protein